MKSGKILHGHLVTIELFCCHCMVKALTLVSGQAWLRISVVAGVLARGRIYSGHYYKVTLTHKA